MNRRKFIETIVSGCASLILLNDTNIQAKQITKRKMGISGFNDQRSKKVIFVAHCVLNQNARIKRYAYWRTGMKPVMRFLEEHDIGVVQMPCPELIFLGLDRKGQIYKQLSDSKIRKGLRDMAKNVCYQILQYRKYGFKVLAVIGIDGSPCCGVAKTWDGHERPGSGRYMIELMDELEKQKIDIALKGIEDRKMPGAIELLTALVQEYI